MQIKICVSCPCPFRGFLNYYCVGNLTHVQRLKDGERTVQRTMNAAENVGEKQQVKSYVRTNHPENGL